MWKCTHARTHTLALQHLANYALERFISLLCLGPQTGICKYCLRAHTRPFVHSPVHTRSRLMLCLFLTSAICGIWEDQ